MKVLWKTPDDPQRLSALVAGESNAKQRDRYRVVLIAGQGLNDQPELERQEIAAAVGRSRQFVDQWVGRYRQFGIGGLIPKPQPGAKAKLAAEDREKLRVLLDAGPPPEEGIAAYNGPILREVIHQKFGKLYSLSGVYRLLHDLGYNDLMPRTTHPETDPATLDAFKKKNSPNG